MFIDIALGVLLAVLILTLIFVALAVSERIAAGVAAVGIAAAVYYLPWRSLAQWAVIIVLFTGFGFYWNKRKTKRKIPDDPYKDAIDREYERRFGRP
jgi:membrane protein implicated in regulation of membrane protease activity